MLAGTGSSTRTWAPSRPCARRRQRRRGPRTRRPSSRSWTNVRRAGLSATEPRAPADLLTDPPWHAAPRPSSASTSSPAPSPPFRWPPPTASPSSAPRGAPRPARRARRRGRRRRGTHRGAPRPLGRRTPGSTRRSASASPTRASSCASMDLPPLEDPKELAAAVRFQAKDELPMALDQAVIDFQSIGIVETPDGPAPRVVARRRTPRHDRAPARRGPRRRPEARGHRPLRLRHGPRPRRRRPGPALYVSVGGLTNLAVAEDGNCLFTRVSGAGLESMAVDLAERQGLTLDHARAWLRHVGLEQDLDAGRGRHGDHQRRPLRPHRRRPPGRHRRPRLARLPPDRRTRAARSVERVVLTGPAVAVPGFAELLERELGLPVEPRRHARAPRARPSACSVAAGLAVEEVAA